MIAVAVDHANVGDHPAAIHGCKQGLQELAFAQRLGRVERQKTGELVFLRRQKVVDQFPAVAGQGRELDGGLLDPGCAIEAGGVVVQHQQRHDSDHDEYQRKQIFLAGVVDLAFAYGAKWRRIDWVRILSRHAQCYNVLK